jgi:hypothetical protein
MQQTTRTDSSTTELSSLQAIFTALGGKRAGETPYLFGTGSSNTGRTADNHPLIAIDAASIDRMRGDLGKGDQRFTVERLILALERTDYPGISYVN